MPASYGRILRLWLPMAGTWLFMSVEAPFLAAIIARLSDPKDNLAAFGVAFAVAILIESPVIMMLSASTALVAGPVSFRRLYRFTWFLNASITALMIVMLATPAWKWIAGEVIDLPPRVVELTYLSLWILLPWPGAIGYRRFYQGLLIRRGLTRRVAYGTVVRLTTMASVTLVLFTRTDLAGALVAAAGLSAGVCAEAIAARLMAGGVARGLRGRVSGAGDDIGYLEIVRFYVPLALTSLLSLVIHPMITFFMGRARYPLESLAVLPVVNALSFIFRSVGLSFQEVAIALLGDDRDNGPRVARFAGVLGVGASVAMSAIVFTPLAGFWFRTLSGLTAELTRFALTPARILAVFPGLSVLLSYQRAVLVSRRQTGGITWATAIEVAGVFGSVALLIRISPWAGATAAAVGILAGRLAGNGYLFGKVRG